MVGPMDNGNLSEGLFLKNYLDTVTAASRSKTVEKKPIYAYEEYSHQKYNNHSLENEMLNHARIIYELGIKNESEIKSEKYQKIDSIQRNANNHIEVENVIEVEIGDEKGKKKEKKWTLGGFFRRKNKKDADDSSEESEEDKKGFLSRRKFRRDRRKFKSRTNTNGFDVVISQNKESTKSGEISVEQLWSCDRKSTEPNSGPLRYISRHPELYKKTNTVQIPKYYQRDSNLFGSIGRNENTEGKKNRKEVMARVEAKRDMLQNDSSSDEYESYRSNSSLNRLNGDCRKPRRMDKRRCLSKDEDTQNDLRGVKSDFEGGLRQPFNNRWISKAYCQDLSDPEAAKLNLMNHSGTPSPCRSPQARQKQLFHYKMINNSYPTSTFPPGVHYQHSKNGSLDMSPTGRDNFAKENQFLVTRRNQTYITKCDLEYPFQKSLSSSDNSNRKTLMDYEHFKNSCGSTREKSLSYDQNIHITPCFKNEFEVKKKNQQTDFKTVVRSGMFANENKKPDVYDHNPQMAVKTYNAVVENKTYSTPSLQFSIFPQKPNEIVRESASANSLCENVKNFHPDRSNSYQNLPSVQECWSQENTPQLKSSKSNISWNVSPTFRSTFQKPHIDKTPSVLRYYTDQNPRSRNPIHITCNSAIPEQPYLSDSQMIVKSLQSVKNSALDFWKIKDKELMKQQKKWENSLKPPPTRSNSKLNRSRSNSPKLNAIMKAVPKSSENIVNEFKSNLIDDYQLRKVPQEEYNKKKISKNPPEPPVRRLSKQEVFARLQKCEQLKKQENEINKSVQNVGKVHSYILDEALNELEVIYSSLSLNDEDLVDRSESKDFPVFRPKSPTTSIFVPDKIQNCLPEINNSKNSELTIPVRYERALPLRRSGIPDKTTDDMAFRRLNQRDRTDVKKLSSQSYLRTSPALFPVQNVNSAFRKESPVLEPDITYDDVVYRSIRHANSTLKIQDPQPPFGIPIGIITPASNSDYLHATPAERFRPTFASSKTPDVVKDDLAFRNLRKDNKTNTCLQPNKNELKKRAVRSLSANLFSIMQKDNPDFTFMGANNFDIPLKNREKTQSLTDLSNGKHALEKRLKELKEERNAKRAEFFEHSRDAAKKGTVSWTDLANLNENFDVTISKLQKIDFPIRSKDSWNKFKSPVVELSKFPAAVPSSSLQSNPFKEPSFIDDDQLESLLSTLSKEAENASKDLEKQLDWLETKKTVNIDDKSKAIEEFNKKFRSLNKTKRNRNLSLSNANDFKEEVRETGSLERRKKINKDQFLFSETLGSRTDEMELLGKVTDKNEIAKLGLERNLSKSKSVISVGCSEREQSQSFEVVTELSEILKDVEVEQHLNSEITQKETNNVFQEVYEYNCKLSSPDDRGFRGGVENVEAIKEASRIPSSTPDVEIEFEKLHEEVNSTKETKETIFSHVDDLMADITSVSQSPGDSYSSFPFPNDSETPFYSGMLNDRGGTSSRSSKGEGEAKKPSLDNNVWVACSYALAFAFHLQEIDFLTALGIVLAVISVVAILIL